MALLFCDSFDHYNTSQLFRKWDTADSPSNVTIASGGRNSTNCLTPIGGTTIYKNLPSNVTTLIVGLAIKFGNTSDASTFMYLYDGSTQQINVTFNTDGSLTVKNGSSTTLGTTSPGALPSPTAAYNYVEIMVLFHASAGTVDIRVNGSSVMALTGKVTAVSGNAYATKMALSRVLPNANNAWVVDDFYLCDTTGSTNNTFLGDVRIEAVVPSGSGATSQLAASTGSDFQCVDDNPANDDTDYVSSSTPGDKSTFALGNLSSSAGSVKALVVNTMDRKDDSGTRTHQHVTRLSGVESNGASFSPATSYANHQTVFETKPGGGAWTISDVNSAEAGLTLAT